MMENTIRKVKKILIAVIGVLIAISLSILFIELFHKCDGAGCVICSSLSISFYITVMLLLISTLSAITLNLFILFIKYNKTTDFSIKKIKDILSYKKYIINNNSLISLKVRLQ